MFSIAGYKQPSFSSDEILSIGGKQSELFKKISPGFMFRRSLKSSLDELSPMFSFYIYKVDKKIFKNTRGKSGKYTFI
jgi:hypothetical protein